MNSMHAASLRVLTGRMAIVAAGIAVSACGVINNHKPIPAGTPTAFIRVGPVTGGFLSQAIRVQDGSQCQAGEYSKGGVIGSYLGPFLDLEVPADRPLFVTLGDHENRGLTTVTCSSGMSMTATPGVHYTMNLLYEDKRCTIVLTKTGSFDRIKTEPLPPRCP